MGPTYLRSKDHFLSQNIDPDNVHTVLKFKTEFIEAEKTFLLAKKAWELRDEDTLASSKELNLPEFVDDNMALVTAGGHKDLLHYVVTANDTVILYEGPQDLRAKLKNISFQNRMLSREVAARRLHGRECLRIRLAEHQMKVAENLAAATTFTTAAATTTFTTATASSEIPELHSEAATNTTPKSVRYSPSRIGITANGSPLPADAPFHVNEPRSFHAKRPADDHPSSSPAEQTEPPAKRVKHTSKKTVEEKQETCRDCMRYPAGIGCRKHKSEQQKENTKNRVPFGRLASGGNCTNCINHGDFCPPHESQRPRPRPQPNVFANWPAINLNENPFFRQSQTNPNNGNSYAASSAFPFAEGIYNFFFNTTNNNQTNNNQTNNTNNQTNNHNNQTNTTNNQTNTTNNQTNNNNQQTNNYNYH